jgi:hypothetical protein
VVARVGVSAVTAVPFACTDDDGTTDASAVVKKRAIRCALSRICGMCGETLTRPVAFAGPEAEAQVGLFAFPPMHLDCARTAIAAAGDAPGLGHPPVNGPWALVTTGGFDLVRPTRRGDPVHFHPNSVIDTSWHHDA